MNIKTTTCRNTIVQPQLKASVGVVSDENKEVKKQERADSQRELDYYVELANKTEVSYNNRIAEIKRQLQEGTYVVSSELIADAMFHQMNGVE